MGIPVATVVIPTHDRPEFARRAVRSALAQTVREVEVLVVDDGSTVPFVAQPHERVRMLRREMAGGPCVARNAGLAVARGEWTAFLDDDDELLPEMVQVSLAEAAASTLPSPVAVLSCVVVVNERGETVDRRCPATLERGRHWFLEGSRDGRFRSERTLLAPTELLRSIGGFDERIRGAEDKDFFLRLNAVCSLQGLARDTYRATLHRGPKQLTDPVAMEEGLRMTLEKHGALIAGYPRHHAKLLGSLAMYELEAGHWLPAIAAATRAVARDPLRLQHDGELVISLSGPWGFRTARQLKRGMDRVGGRR